MEYFASIADPAQGLSGYTFTTGGSTPSVLTYADNWDAGAMFGCACDDGYEGHDCALWTCPKGDDPLPSSSTSYTTQRLSCAADGGSFVLGFRGPRSERRSSLSASAMLQDDGADVPTPRKSAETVFV